jgi:hypothetical protein
MGGSSSYSRQYVAENCGCERYAYRTVTVNRHELQSDQLNTAVLKLVKLEYKKRVQIPVRISRSSSGNSLLYKTQADAGVRTTVLNIRVFW